MLTAKIVEMWHLCYRPSGLGIRKGHLPKNSAGVGSGPIPSSYDDHRTININKTTINKVLTYENIPNKTNAINNYILPDV
jgi:hypothetical protein